MPIISAQLKSGHRVVAVKNRVMFSKKWVTFFDFLDDYIKSKLGGEWGNAELSRPLDVRHPILLWYHHVCELQRVTSKGPGKVSSAPMTGAAAAYYRLAYDIYALDHNAELQEKLLARLRDRDNFEGARYEVLVAAALIRAGFSITFENEDDRSTTHCEFSALYPKTGRAFSVEAKHRAGTRFRFRRQLIRALSKQANHPRIVFINLNVPDDGSTPGAPPLLDTAMNSIRALAGKTINGQPLPPAYVLVTNTPWHLHLTSSTFRTCGMAEGFQIPDFKTTGAPALRGVIEARERHIEFHALLRSMEEHNEIPATFDGEIPEFAFGEATGRLLIGQRYVVAGPDGMDSVGVLTAATVMESEQAALCSLFLDNGKAVTCEWPLTANEMAAWRRYPDTFFGAVGQRKTRADTPIELYDFFLETYQKTPKEKLIEFMQDAADIEELKSLDQPVLASIFAERTVYGAMASAAKKPQPK